MKEVASLYRLEIFLGKFRGVREGLSAEGTFEPAEAFEDVRPVFDKAAASGLPWDAAWARWIGPLRLSLVFPDGTRTGDFVLRLEGKGAKVAWREEESRESGE